MSASDPRLEFGPVSVDPPRLALSEPWPRAALVLVVLGLATAASGVVWSPRRAWSNLLLAEAYVLGLALAGALLLCIHHLTGAGWSAAVRRVPEAMMGGLPAFALLALPLLLARPILFPAPLPEDGAWVKAHFMGTPLVALRSVVILAAWVLLARALRRLSLRQDAQPGRDAHRRLVRLSAVFVPVLAVSLTLASVDWLMALAPGWTSTAFTVYVFAGLMVSGLAALTLIVIALERGRLHGVIGPGHLHDLGTLLFTFSTFWAYIWLSQYLLIWYADLPEEIPHYLRRTEGAWLLPFLLNLAVNWVLPFAVLLSRAAKRSPRVLAAVCVLLLFGHWLDLYLLIMPETMGGPALGPLELLLPAGFAALFALLTARALARAPLLPRGDPFLVESLERHA